MISSRGSAVIIISVTFTAVAVVTLVGRLVARYRFLKNGGPDDISIVIALVFSVALVVTTALQVEHGLGKHVSQISQPDFSEFVKYLWLSIILYSLSLTTIKISILLQYLRVFSTPRIRFACWTTIAFTVMYGAEMVLTTIFRCTPASASRKGETDDRHRCVNMLFLGFFNATLNILTDAVILVLPIPLLSTLSLPMRQKVGLLCVFALGGFVCLVSVLRLHSLYLVATGSDLPWDNTAIAIWSNIEVATGIICACLPAMKPVIAHMFPGLLSMKHSMEYTLPSQGRSSDFRFAASQTVGSQKNSTANIGAESAIGSDCDLDKGFRGSECGRKCIGTASTDKGLDDKETVLIIQYPARSKQIENAPFSRFDV